MYAFVVAFVEVEVSIPHRYCKNWQGAVDIPTLDGVSIPHRYCKNIPAFLVYLSFPTVSIPHRYCKNNLSRYSEYCDDVGFNSS